MTTSPIRLVIFDCDGVLVDSEELSMRVLLQTVAELGVTIEPAAGFRDFLGKSLPTVCALLLREYQIELTPAALERMRHQLYKAFRQQLCAMPGVVDVLVGLQQPFCVASSSQLERIGVTLEVTKLASFFTGKIFSASMVDRGKPAPDLFLHAAQTMQVGPEHCLVIEDSPAGVSAARAAGMSVFGFTGGSHARTAAYQHALDRLGPSAVFSDMRDLPALIGGLDENRRGS